MSAKEYDLLKKRNRAAGLSASAWLMRLETNRPVLFREAETREMCIRDRRLGEYVHQRDPSWNWGKPVKPGILNEYHQGIDRKA